MQSEKRPREYAYEIIALPREQRKKAFEAVPDHLKALTKKHVENHFQRDPFIKKKEDKS